MSETPNSETPNSETTTTPFDAEPLFLMMRRKEGTWVDWAQACQQLQKAGHSPQSIFEETGFEPIQQNQIIVAAQVYAGFADHAPPEVLAHFKHRASDILYELRILTLSERVAAATFALEFKLDSIDAHDFAKALKDFSRISNPPEAFTNHPGDAVAHQCWTHAREHADLQERSRLIAKGLRFVHSDGARKELEKLLTDFSVVKKQPTPRLPMCQLESELELPRILPLVGKMPLPVDALKAVPFLEEEGAFRAVQFAEEGAWVPLPGWQVLLRAEDPVAVLCRSDLLPVDANQPIEEVLLVIDRAHRDWDSLSYFAIASAGQLHIQWFPEAPDATLLGRVLLVVRPKRILDESVTHDMWLLEE